MRRMLLAIMVLGSAQALMAQTVTSRVKPHVQPAETLSVTDIPVPFFCAADGTVVLDAVVTETGEVQEVEVRRDITCLTQLAVQAVEDWKFSPATLAGKAIASRMPVAVTFHPATSAGMTITSGTPLALPALILQSKAAIQAELQPAEVTRAALPKYPYNTFVAGSVTLEVSLNEKGEAEKVRVLRDLLPLTEESKAVVGDWRFMPATFNGKPVQSKIVLAFVFRPPIVNNLP